ncbi:MAG: cytochrome C oxidase subunit IV family protein [Candidatus Binataceae bacterium]
MSEIAHAEEMHGATHHPGAVTYVIIAVILVVLTALEITVFYVHALQPVLVPLLLILSAAKFVLVVMFYMHLKYDQWLLSGIFVFPLFIAMVMLFSLILLFTYLSHYPAPVSVLIPIP